MLFFIITDNYRTIASELCSLAKSQGSRDNISVIVVYLKEPELIATQSWPSEITQNKEIMEDIFNTDPAKVSMDTLGNQVRITLLERMRVKMSIKTVTNSTFSRIKSITSRDEVDRIMALLLFSFSFSFIL